MPAGSPLSRPVRQMQSSLLFELSTGLGQVSDENKHEINLFSSEASLNLCPLAKSLLF